MKNCQKLLNAMKDRRGNYDTYEDYFNYDSDDHDRYVFGSGNYDYDDYDYDQYDDDSDGSFSDPEANFNKFSGLTQVNL